MTALLEVRDLVKHYRPRGVLGRSRAIHAVNGVSFDVGDAETLGLVGESGSGKSTVGRLVIGLEPATAGQVSFAGEVVSGRPDRRQRLRLARQLQIVFQDPFTTLNPRLSVAESVAEGLEIHRIGARAERRQRVARLLTEVGLDPADADRYPHEFSGGQRQRIGIARALAVEPRFVVCDEPVSALDVSVRAQVVNLFRDLQARRGLSYLFIAHDLAVVAQLAHQVAVMYLGALMETGPTRSIITAPRHPYTRALLSAVPSPDPERRPTRIPLGGDPPDPTRIPPGCPFVERCYHPAKDERCRLERPVLRPIETTLAACHYAETTPEIPRAEAKA